MLLTYTHEYMDKAKKQLQHLVIEAEANSKEEAEELGYDDFKAWLYINKRLVVDNNNSPIELSGLLMQSGGFESIIDEQNWAEQFCDRQAEIAA